MRRILLVLAGLVVFLTGCIKADFSVTISEDGLVSGEMTMALNVEQTRDLLLEFMEESPDVTEEDIEDFEAEYDEDEFVDDFTEDMRTSAEDLETDGSIDVEDYEDGDFRGVTVSFEDLTIDEFNEMNSDDDGGITLEEDGDEFVLVGTLEGSTDDAAEDLGEIPPEMEDLLMEALADAEVIYEVTFPSEPEVVEGPWDVDGCTASWEPNMADVMEEGENVDYEVRAASSGSCGSSSSFPIALAAGGAGLFFLLLLVIVIILLVRSSKKKKRAASPAAPAAPTAATMPPPSVQAVPPAPAPAPAPEPPAAPAPAPEPPAAPAPAPEPPAAPPTEPPAAPPTEPPAQG